jgi:hypothetical protein
VLLAASAFSIWAPWFLASLAIAAVCSVIGMTLIAPADIPAQAQD